MDSNINLPSPIALKNDEDLLVIEWSDGAKHTIRWSRLRESCPCATCRAKRTESPELLPILNPEEAQHVKPTSMSPMGNYAYNIAFNDGHNTGIYSFELLRALGEGID